MPKGYFKPKIDLQLTIRDITAEFASDVGGVLKNAIGEINELARVSQQVVESALAQIAEGEEPNLREMEDQLIYKALEQTKGNKTAAARKLGISVRKIYRWMKEQEGGSDSEL